MGKDRQDATLQKLRKMFDEVETEYRPDLRWWLAEGLNTDETLRKNVKEIYDSGFGSAEFLAMPEPGADSSIYGWGSEEWNSDTRLIVEEAARLGLGFSLTSGAHWANANLPDTYVWRGEPYGPDSKAAAKELDYATILLNAGERFDGQLPLPVKIESVGGDIHGIAATYKEQLFQAVVAAKILEPRKGSGQSFGFAQGEGTGVLDPATLVDLTGKVRESGGAYQLDWTAPDDGQYVLLVYWMHGTGQTASPSVSTNYTINYMDSYGVEALIDYWEEIVLDDRLREIIQKSGRGEIYMDSLELVTYGAGGIFWGYNLREEFTKAKGYDIVPYLPLLTTDGVRVESKKAKQFDYTVSGAENLAVMKKVRNDFYSVISDMYVYNVLGPLQKWLHSLNMILRAEPSYGMNFEISTPAKYIDGIETESFAQVADADLYRGILGSANMYGRVFSSETGAVAKHNYYYNMDDWTQLCYLQFAEGVSRTVFHGYSAIEGSEEDTYWPGHEGMYQVFSERFNSRQPASRHYPAWTKMLARNQKALRQGAPARDIAILRTDYFYVNYGQPEGYDTFASNFFMHDIPYFWQDLSLQQAGYTYDYFSPLLLEDTSNVSWTGRELQPNGPAYRAVIVYQEGLELSAAKKLLEVVKGGLPILFVNNNTEIVDHDGTKIAHGKAASVSRSLNDSDLALRDVVAQIKALPNAREVDSPADALPVLRELGVQPKVAFCEPNSKILTMSRRDEENQLLYTFVHSYKFEVEKGAPPLTFDLVMEGLGTTYCIDDWTGAVEKLPAGKVENGITSVTLTMGPGEAKLIVLDLGDSDSAAASPKPAEYGAAIPLTAWDIVVEDWNGGDKVVNTEEKFGHVTREVYFTTKKTPLTFKNQKLVSWKDLPATGEQLASLAGESPSMAHVSGIGFYTTEFQLPADWSAANGAVLEMESAGGGTVEVYVNGEKAPGVNTRTLRVDISGLVKPGSNALEIEVASTLTNRMIQRNYKDRKSGWDDNFPQVQAYGLQGEVRVVPYTR
ncbi:MAG: glycosyl hydrolase [Oscillospiraceae bacterium]